MPILLFNDSIDRGEKNKDVKENKKKKTTNQQEKGNEEEISNVRKENTYQKEIKRNKHPGKIGKTNKQVSDTVRKTIVEDYILTNNMAEVARKHGITRQYVSKIIKDESDYLGAYKEAQKISVAQLIEKQYQNAGNATMTIELYYKELRNPEKVKKVNPREAATIIGIITDKQLKLEEIRLRQLELSYRAKEIEAMREGIKIEISPEFKDFSKVDENQEEGSNDDGISKQ